MPSRTGALAVHGCDCGQSRFVVTHFSQTRGGGGSRALQLLNSCDLLGLALGRFCCERVATLSRVPLPENPLRGRRWRTNQRRDTVVPFVFFSSFEGSGFSTCLLQLHTCDIHASNARGARVGDLASFKSSTFFDFSAWVTWH